jgi:hypothetical protein
MQPREALLSMMYLASGHVTWLQTEIAELDDLGSKKGEAPRACTARSAIACPASPRPRSTPERPRGRWPSPSDTAPRSPSSCARSSPIPNWPSAGLSRGCCRLSSVVIFAPSTSGRRTDADSSRPCRPRSPITIPLGRAEETSKRRLREWEGRNEANPDSRYGGYGSVSRGLRRRRIGAGPGAAGTTTNAGETGKRGRRRERSSHDGSARRSPPWTRRRDYPCRNGQERWVDASAHREEHHRPCR